MPWGVAAAAVGGALVSGYIGSQASEDASHASTQAADQATGVQREMYQTTRSDLAPFRDTGASALQMLSRLTGITGGADSGKLTAGYGNFNGLSLADFSKDPGYQFRQSEGEKAIERGAMSRGLNTSSATLKNMMRFNQGLASDEYSRAYGRKLNEFTTNFGVDSANKERQFNMLQALSTSGQNAAAMTGTAGSSAASGAGQALIAGGAATSQGIMSGASSINNAVQGGISNYMYQKRFDDMMSRFPVFSGGGGMPTSNFEYTGTTAAGGNQYG